MGTKVNSNYEDLITYTRASKGHALRPVSYGNELVTNGTFDGNADGWTGGGYDVETGDLSLVSASSLNVYQQGFDPTKFYLLTYTVSEYTSGNISAYDGALFGPFTNAVGTYTIVISPRVQRLGVRGQNGPVDAKISSISVKEFTFDQPDGTLTLFEHPENVPRVEYDADGNRLGLLVEEQRINLVPYSDFSTGWAQTRSTLTEGAITSPDGQLNGASIKASTHDNSHYIADTISISSSTRYTSSVFFKAGGKNWATIYNGAGNVYFDLENGVIGNITGTNNTTAQIQEIGNGWYRCSISFDASASATSYFFAIGPALANGDNTYAGDNSTEEIYVYGAQVEAGSFPTSYMKNEGTASGATRSADVASIPVADFGYNQSAGTVVVEATTSHPANLTNQQMWQANDGTSVNRIEIYQSGSGNPWPRVTAVFRDNNSTTQTFLCQTNGWESNNRDIEKVGFAYKSGSSILDTTTDDSPALGTADIPTGMTQVIFAHRGHIKSIKYYPRRLTNAQLQDLTS